MPTETASETPAKAGELSAPVPEAAAFLGVSPQTVYLLVERKQIPHFRMRHGGRPMQSLGCRLY